MSFKNILTAALVAVFALVAVPSTTSAATMTVREGDVTRQPQGTLPTTKDWVIYTQANTTAEAKFVTGPSTPPSGTGSLELKTTSQSDKVYAFYFGKEGTKLADIDTIKYSTYRSMGDLQQVAALNMVIDYNGAADGGFATLVFEPVYNTDQGAVISGEWQEWTASGTGTWWSTRAINNQCAGATATCDTTWDDIKANNPDAVIKGGFGVNQGSGNLNLTTAVDKLIVNEDTYDFEDLEARATTKEQCKNDGFKNFKTSYKNQGDCVSAVASQGKAKGNPIKEENPIQSFFRSIGF